MAAAICVGLALIAFWFRCGDSCNLYSDAWWNDRDSPTYTVQLAIAALGPFAAAGAAVAAARGRQPLAWTSAGVACSAIIAWIAITNTA